MNADETGVDCGGSCSAKATCAKCSTTTCGANQVRFDNKECGAVTCAAGDAATCCGDRQQCKAATGLKCDSNARIKDPGTNETYCAGTECKEVECCVDRAACSTFSCNANTQKRNDEELCAGKACAAADDAATCCVDRQQCKAASDLQCDQGRIRDATKADQYCDGAKCAESECCIDRGKCSTVTCGDKQINMGSAFFCAGPTCAAADRATCCKDLPQCGNATDVKCPPGTIRLDKWDKSLGGKYCKALQCQPTECCVLKPTCKDLRRNGDETGEDCGGSCPACPTCLDQKRNGDEEGKDCGGSCVSCPEDPNGGNCHTSTADHVTTGYILGGVPAKCSQLTRYCCDHTHAAKIRGVCPVSCRNCEGQWLDIVEDGRSPLTAGRWCRRR